MIELACPICRLSVVQAAGRYTCRACGRDFPIIEGIPDFRIEADPYISIEDDREKGRRLAGMAKSLSFTELVDAYYAMTPEVTPEQRGRFVAHHQAGESRGESILARAAGYGQTIEAGPLLDAGCGSAGLAVAAARRGIEVAGVDIAFRWLIVARKRLEQAGVAAQLICASVRALPFPDKTFRSIIAENLLEHTGDAPAVLRELLRLLGDRGAFLARSVNRFSLGGEPHTGLWGVGFLPRPWMRAYVRWQKGIDYRVRLESPAALRRALRQAGGTSFRVGPPLLSDQDFAHLSPNEQRLFRSYRALGRVGLLRPFLTFFGPFLDISNS